MRISIVLFSYNECETIEVVIRACINFLKKHSESFEIIVVDDGSTDNTAEVLSRFIAAYPNAIKLIVHPVNMGIGMALRTGYQAAALDYVCAVPTDNQFDISELQVIKPFDKNTYYSFYRRSNNYNLYRTILTWINRLFNQHVLGIYLRDVNWIKMYKKSQLELVKPELKSSLVESEICAKLYKCGIMPIEIPSNYLERKYGKSKGGGWKTLKKAILEIAQLFFVVQKFDAKALRK